MGYPKPINLPTLHALTMVFAASNPLYQFVECASNHNPWFLLVKSEVTLTIRIFVPNVDSIYGTNFDNTMFLNNFIWKLPYKHNSRYVQYTWSSELALRLPV